MVTLYRPCTDAANPIIVMSTAAKTFIARDSAFYRTKTKILLCDLQILPIY